jgi:tetratricopeptide (TPR) repeat protein
MRRRRRLEAAVENIKLTDMSNLRHRLLASLFSAAALSFCAGAASAEPDATHSAYGEFLAGSAALDQGDARAATAFFARGAGAGPDASLMKARAFSAALLAGEVHKAALLAPDPNEASVGDADLGRLTRAVDLLAQGRAGKAQAVLTAGPPFGAPHLAAAILLTPWVAAAAGDWKTALALPDTHGDRLIASLSAFDQAVLLEENGRFDEADAAFRKLLGGGAASDLFTSAYGEFLERRGRRADALALYDAALKGDPSNTMLSQARARAAAGKPPPEPTLVQGAARSLLASGAIYLSEKQPELGLSYLRLVLWLDPTRDEAWLMVGDTFEAAGDHDAAREAYGELKPGQPEFVNARVRLVATYDQPDQVGQALAIAEDTAKAAPDDVEAQSLLAESLRDSERYAESAAVMDKVIATLGAHANWQLYYMRAAALTECDQWPAAEKDLLKALTLEPNQPEVLNFLGFSWIDRGERLPEAKAMVEKAAEAMPDSGAIVDSLGWAYYRMGDYAHAVEQLERAIQLDAGDPDINDHLGDAYWKVGRQIEARFQWERVLTLHPTAKMRAKVEEKLRLHPVEGSSAARAPLVALR